MQKNWIIKTEAGGITVVFHPLHSNSCVVGLMPREATALARDLYKYAATARQWYKDIARKYSKKPAKKSSETRTTKQTTTKKTETTQVTYLYVERDDLLPFGQTRVLGKAKRLAKVVAVFGQTS